MLALLKNKEVSLKNLTQKHTNRQQQAGWMLNDEQAWWWIMDIMTTTSQVSVVDTYVFILCVYLDNRELSHFSTCVTSRNANCKKDTNKKLLFHNIVGWHTACMPSCTPTRACPCNITFSDMSCWWCYALLDTTTQSSKLFRSRQFSRHAFRW